MCGRACVCVCVRVGGEVKTNEPGGEALLSFLRRPASPHSLCSGSLFCPSFFTSSLQSFLLEPNKIPMFLRFHKKKIAWTRLNF